MLNFFSSRRCHCHDGPVGPKDQPLDQYPSPPAAMSSEATAELADLVHEWLRIDQVRADNVLP
jgi:hypothetical protein